MIDSTIKVNKKVVKVCMRGGLGNQCFQYAIARSLSDATDSGLVLDLSEFASDHVYKRFYSLDAFKVRVDHLTYAATKPVQVFKKIRYRLASHFLGHVGNYWCEKRPYRYQQLPTGWRSAICLDGYWQSELYFAEYAKQIASDLEFKDPKSYANDRVAQLIRASQNPVFLHLRSYKEVPGGSNGSNALPLSYYENALAHLRGILGNEFSVFVFSDDPAWARLRLTSNLHKNIQFVETLPSGEINNAFREFFLMRLCKHGIVANSSFSWWGGWLGEQDWLAKGERPIRIRVNHRCMNDDYWPRRWIAIDKK
jgi:Glycosyl transferase family 11